MSGIVKQNLDILHALSEKTNEVNALKEEVKLLKEQIDDISKSPVASNEDINVTRLRKTYQNLEKQKLKQEDTHKKQVAELEKSRRDAQEDLKIAIKKQKDCEDEKNTIVQIFGCMKQLLDKNPVISSEFPTAASNSETLVAQNVNNGAIKKFTCTDCYYQGENSDSLNQHKRDKHLIDLTVNYPCDTCDYNAENMTNLRKHKKSEHEFKCDFCDFISKSKGEAEKHEMDKHNCDDLQCDMCTSKLKTKDGLTAHTQLFHNSMTTYSCNKCEYKASQEPDLEQHKAENHRHVPKNSRDYGDRDVRNKKRFCHFWNYGSCYNGDKCEYLHEEIPLCCFDNECDNDNCSFFHTIKRKTKWPQRKQQRNRQ